MDLLPALPMTEPSFLLLLLAEVAMGEDAGNQLLPALATLPLFLPSSTVGVASPDLQGELILPSFLEQQKFNFSYIAEMPGTGSVTSYSITEMITSIHGHVWHPYCTEDVDKLERIREGAARRIQSQKKMP